MKVISILTPVSRIDNIKIIESDFKNFTDRIKILWYLCFDAKLDSSSIPFIEDSNNLYVVQMLSPYKNAIGGHEHRNYMLNKMKPLNSDKLIYFLDDDNLLTESFVNFVANDSLDEDVYMFSQKKVTGDKISGINTLRIGHVDTAQILCKLKCFDNWEFPNIYEADGHWILYLWSKFRRSFKFVPDVFTNYNKLRS